MSSKALRFPWPKLETRDWVLIALLSGALVFAFARMFELSWEKWFDENGYYQHGWFAPLLAGYMIYRSWGRLKEIGVHPAAWGMAVVLGGLVVLWHGVHVDSQVIRELGFMVTLVGGCIYALGPGITKALTMPFIIIAFMLPIPDLLFTELTNWGQVYSTKTAVKVLEVIGYDPYMQDNSIITMDNYTLYVGVPCSGFKLTMALLMFAVFFSAIARFNWWRVVVMFVVLIPVALVVNSLRIAAIGIFGENFGERSAQLFHDYGSYLELILAYGALFLLARWLGWKD